MRQLGDLVGSLELVDGFDHAVEVEFTQLVESWMSEHDVVS
jgi:hypothetical protein